jgi:hypothetical protein
MSAEMTIEFSHDQPLMPFVKGVVVGLASALLVAWIVGGDYRMSHVATATPAPTRAVALFTGAYENGVPVYRLPPIEITARRDAN